MMAGNKCWNTSHITSLQLVSLSHVIVLIGVILVPLHVISVNQGLDPLLQVRWLHWELKLVVEFGEKQVVTQRLPHLHNSDYGGINLILSVLENSLLCGLLLVSSLLQLYLIDFDLVKSIGEVLVVGKLVTVIYVFALWYLGQDSRLTASQRLQCSPHLSVLDVGLVFNFLQRQLVHIVELEHTEGLEQRHLQLLLSRFKVCPEDTVTQTGLPLQLSPGVFALVELVEYFLISQHVGRDGHIHHWVGRPERHRENVHCQVNLVTFLDVVVLTTTTTTEVLLE